MNRSREESRRRVLAVMRWPVGGIRTYLLYNYPWLAQEGYSFTLVGPADHSFRTLCQETASWRAVEFVEAPLVGGRCALRRTISRLLKERRWGLIHSHGLTAGAEAVLANLGRGVPHLITSHDVIRPSQAAGLAGRLKLRLLGWLLSRADVLVAVSRDARENHLRYLPSLRRGICRVVTIRNGVDISRLDAHEPLPTDRLRQRLAVPNDAYLLGFFGRFMEQKGFLVLLEAIDRVLAEHDARRMHLVAVGSGDYRREYQAEAARRARLAQRICFLDHAPNVAPLLRGLDLLVMPSLWEACPLLPMEAMCLGVPVLGSDCIGLREVLAGSPSRMVPAGDAAALACAIRQAMHSPWKEEAQVYAAVARRRFDVRAAAAQLAGLFDQLAG